MISMLVMTKVLHLRHWHHAEIASTCDLKSSTDHNAIRKYSTEQTLRQRHGMLHMQ